MVIRQGVPRLVLTVAFHVTAILLVTISLGSYVYLQSTGFPLEYAIIAYYLGNLGEARGAVGAEAPTMVWPLLALVLVHLVAGPAVIGRAVSRRFILRGGDHGGGRDGRGAGVSAVSTAPVRASAYRGVPRPERAGASLASGS